MFRHIKWNVNTVYISSRVNKSQKCKQKYKWAAVLGRTLSLIKCTVLLSVKCTVVYELLWKGWRVMPTLVKRNFINCLHNVLIEPTGNVLAHYQNSCLVGVYQCWHASYHSYKLQPESSKLSKSMRNSFYILFVNVLLEYRKCIKTDMID